MRVQLSDNRKHIKKITTPNHTAHMPNHTDLYYRSTSVFGKIWYVIGGVIFSLQITDMAGLHGIKITDDLHINNKLLQDPDNTSLM